MLLNVNKVTFNDQFGNPCSVGDTIVYFSQQYGLRKCTIIKIEQVQWWCDAKLGTNIRVRPIENTKRYGDVSLRKFSSFMKV